MQPTASTTSRGLRYQLRPGVAAKPLYTSYKFKSVAGRNSSITSAVIASQRLPLQHRSICNEVFIVSSLNGFHAAPVGPGNGKRSQRKTAAQRAVRCAASKSGASVRTQATAVTNSTATEVVTEPTARARRLTTLVELRDLYRNCLRAYLLLQEPSPVYTPPEPAPEDISLEEADLRADEENAHKTAVIELVADMQLTSERLKADLRTLPIGFGAILAKGKDGDGEELVRIKAKDYSQKLRERSLQELPFLPFSSTQAAQVALDVRNARYLPTSRLGGVAQVEDGSPQTSPIQRLEKAEKVAEKFVEQRIKPALKRAQQGDLVEVVQESSAYLRGLWDRLNGGGARDPSLSAALDLPRPTSTRKDVDHTISIMTVELGAVEKKLQEASKTRESQLRKAGGQGRVRLAFQLKTLDAEVYSLSRQLAVRQLQLEMEWVYRSLEEEALEVVRDAIDTRALGKDSSTEELALLVAEFTLLDEQLQLLQSTLQDGSALSLVGDELLEKLAEEIPDMRIRVGVGDQLVYGGSGWSMTKVQLSIKEAQEALQEAINFLTRGVRLLGSDLGNSGRLFAKAVVGGTLRPREVTALRRTATDLLAFIPFTIILIIPLSPLGHVLVFGFIQRYFPSLFPSQFSTRRQEIMMRYEELASQLLEAQQQAEQEEEEAELARAAAAVARLTAPSVPSSSANGKSPPSGGAGGDASGGDETVGEAAMKVKLLEQELEAVKEDVTRGEEPAPPKAPARSPVRPRGQGKQQPLSS